MANRKFLYEGKAKMLYEGDSPDELIQVFKDDATAFDGKKKGSIGEKGKLNNTISSKIFEFLEAEGIKTHFLKKISDTEAIVRKVEIIPVEVVIRNIAAGSLSKRMGIQEGLPLNETIVEFYYKSDELGDPMINEDHIRAFELATDEEIAFIKKEAIKINSLLDPFFAKINITLVDYKLEFGRYKGEVILADEISPDGCRLWDRETGERLDKDRFRRDLGKIEESYQEVCNRVMATS